MSAEPLRPVGVLRETALAAAPPSSTPSSTSPLDLAAVLRERVAGHGRVLTRLRPGTEPVIDHILVWPAGIDVVQVRPVNGRVGLHAARARVGRSLYVDGDDRTAWLADLDGTVAEVRDELGRSPLARLRRGWLCLDGADWHEVPTGFRLAGYPVLPPALVGPSLPDATTFGTAHVAVAAERLANALGIVSGPTPAH